jgi:hypothetical protein
MNATQLTRKDDIHRVQIFKSTQQQESCKISTPIRFSDREEIEMGLDRTIFHKFVTTRVYSTYISTVLLYGHRGRQFPEMVVQFTS